MWPMSLKHAIANVALYSVLLEDKVCCRPASKRAAQSPKKRTIRAICRTPTPVKSRYRNVPILPDR